MHKVGGELEVSPAAYWNAALARITAARLGLRGQEATTVWRRLEWLTVLEQFARTCLEMACPEPQGARTDLVGNKDSSTFIPYGIKVGGQSTSIAAKAEGFRFG